jgi:hypothetical protein
MYRAKAAIIQTEKAALRVRLEQLERMLLEQT